MDPFLESILNNVFSEVVSPVNVTPFIQNVEEALDRIDDDLDSLDSNVLPIRNKQRKRRRLIAKKEKMKVKLHLAIRELTDQELTTNEKRSLHYYHRKLESDADFMYRKLCTDLDLTLSDWDVYLE